MEFEPSERVRRLQGQVGTFMREEVLPNEVTYATQLAELGDPHGAAPILDELRERARAAGLWNLFLPDPDWGGAGLTNLEYAPLAELMGWSLIGPDCFNCNAPDTGNMETLWRFGSDEQKERWLRPLLEGRMRSSFAMTEPDVASSDATNITTSIVPVGDGGYVVDGRKWWSTNAPSSRCEFFIVMGKTDTSAPRHRQHSMIIVPRDTPGVTIERSLSVFGYDEGRGHGQVHFDQVRVPAENLLVGEGEGFAIAQGRLGPGRIHHCMRAIGQAERALELLCRRASGRSTFGQRLVDHQTIRMWIAESRCEIEQARLLVLKAAWMMDRVGNKEARAEIGMIKIVAPRVALNVIDRAIQVHGAAGLSQDTHLAHHFAHARALRIIDGPDEVHLLSLARQELRRQLGDDARSPRRT